ncbi:MAG TPA: DNA-binding protein [Methylobacter sp.]|jgi:chromosome segregation ATPase
MAREATITQEQVSAAANKIKGTGTKPTNRLVLEELGSGSMATIVKYMQIWKAGQEPQAQSINIDIDPAVSLAISNMLTRRIQDGTAEANAKIAELQTDLANVITENERQAAENERLASELAESQALAQAQSGQIEELKAASLRLEESTAAAIEEATKQAHSDAAAREAAQVSLAKAELRLEALPRLESEIQRLRGELAIEAARAVDAEKSAAVATARLSDAQEQGKVIEELRSKMAGFIQQFSKANAAKAPAKKKPAKQVAPRKTTK